MNKIEEFLNEYESKGTRIAYKSILKRYFKVIKADANKYFKQKRNYENDVKKFRDGMNGWPPKTFNLYLSCVKTFLIENNIDLGIKFWRHLKGRKKGAKSNKALTKDRIPTIAELRKILSHATAKERSFFLFLATSGMRIGELCKLQLNDIFLDETPVRIDIKPEYTKTGERRTAFISNETTEALREWLKIRQEWLDVAVKKVNFENVKKSSDDPRIFPFDRITAWTYWQRIIRKSGFTEKDTVTDRYVLHPHSLRKFFRTRMPKAIGLDMTEQLLGHSGYLSEYRKYSDKELADTYLNGMSAVSIYGTPDDISGISEQLKEKDMEIVEMKKEMEIMRNQMNILMAGKLIEMDKKKG